MSLEFPLHSVCCCLVLVTTASHVNFCRSLTTMSPLHHWCQPLIALMSGLHTATGGSCRGQGPCCQSLDGAAEQWLHVTSRVIWAPKGPPAPCSHATQPSSCHSPPSDAHPLVSGPCLPQTLLSYPLGCLPHHLQVFFRFLLKEAHGVPTPETWQPPQHSTTCLLPHSLVTSCKIKSTFCFFFKKYSLEYS